MEEDIPKQEKKRFWYEGEMLGMYELDDIEAMFLKGSKIPKQLKRLQKRLDERKGVNEAWGVETDKPEGASAKILTFKRDNGDFEGVVVVSRGNTGEDLTRHTSIINTENYIPLTEEMLGQLDERQENLLTKEGSSTDGKT